MRIEDGDPAVEGEDRVTPAHFPAYDWLRGSFHSKRPHPDTQAFYADLHNRARNAGEDAGVVIHSELFEGDEMKGLLHLADRLRPDLLVLGLRFEPDGKSQYPGGTAHKLALHASRNILGIR